MTSNENTSNPIPFKEFTALKQTGFFENLKQPRFSGQLLLTGPRQAKWVFYLYLGRLVYATGGNHPVRRWRRNLVAHLPHVPNNMSAIQGDVDRLELDEYNNCWEYELLCFWVEQQKVTLEQAAKMIRQNIVEVLFDVTQAVQVTCELKPDKNLPFSTRLVLIDAEQVIIEAQKGWHAWQSAKIADRSPDMAPIITQPQELEQQTNPQIYQTLSQLLDGQQTLRDLSVRMKRDVVTVTRSLLPYVQRGLVRLIEISDLEQPKLPIHRLDDETLNNQKITIACVDDSPLICQTMEKIITSAGYNFIGVNDALRAIAVLLAKKPDLIFLDLIMPNANGYEICSQLRKLTFFKHTPIVILTGNDGLVDRVRAKMVGSSDFISKPVDTALVLETIRKHLRLSVS
ncbi:two-component response regulator [Geminocystis sp. NIES-3708]|uniref:response regulator n=1 Tax=Geminocystis sp. NIES-3708 TaxID=1615909 RepID=UPI0005FCB805|nr:response regulator [Geminocystis sp. NIES-3708]BAQ61320.1 two-component response regulator [Geminocystis sp. NIES-3708]